MRYLGGGIGHLEQFPPANNDEGVAAHEDAEDTEEINDNDTIRGPKCIGETVDDDGSGSGGEGENDDDGEDGDGADDDDDDGEDNDEDMEEGSDPEEEECLDEETRNVY